MSFHNHKFIIFLIWYKFILSFWNFLANFFRNNLSFYNLNHWKFSIFIFQLNLNFFCIKIFHMNRFFQMLWTFRKLNFLFKNLIHILSFKIHIFNFNIFKILQYHKIRFKSRCNRSYFSIFFYSLCSLNCCHFIRFYRF